MEVQKSQPHQPNHESISNHLDNIADVRHERREVTKQQVVRVSFFSPLSVDFDSVSSLTFSSLLTTPRSKQ